MKFKISKEDELILNQYPNSVIKQINKAIKNNKAIIIKGPQGPTGKTTLYNLLKRYNVIVYEEFECCVINLD